MPKLATPLNDIQVKNAKAKAKDYRLADGGGLYLLVNKDGAKYWRMDYRLNDRRNTLAFGKYPEIALAKARDQRKAAREPRHILGSQSPPSVTDGAYPKCRLRQ